MPLTLTYCPPEIHYLFHQEPSLEVYIGHDDDAQVEEQRLHPSVSHDDEEEAELTVTAASSVDHQRHQVMYRDPEQEGQRSDESSSSRLRSPLHDLTNVTNRRRTHS